MCNAVSQYCVQQTYGECMMEQSTAPKRGPKPKYDREKAYHRGAPRLATRIAPEALEWIESQQEGVRPYLERIVLEDKALRLRADLKTST